MTNRRARSVEPAGQSFFVHSIPRADPLLYYPTATPPIFGFCSRAKSTSRTTTASLSPLPFLRPALRTRPRLPSLYVCTHLASHCCASPDSLPCLMLILAPARSPPHRLCRQLWRRAMPRTIGVGSPLAQPTAQPPQNDMSVPAAPPSDHDAFAMEEDEASPPAGSAPPASALAACASAAAESSRRLFNHAEGRACLARHGSSSSPRDRYAGSPPHATCKRDVGDAGRPQ